MREDGCERRWVESRIESGFELRLDYAKKMNSIQ